MYHNRIYSKWIYFGAPGDGLPVEFPWCPIRWTSLAVVLQFHLCWRQKTKLFCRGHSVAPGLLLPMMAMIYLVWIWRLDLVIHRFINALNSLSSGEQRNRTPEHWVSQRHLGGLGSVQWRQLRGSLQADWGQGQVLHLQDCGSTTHFFAGMFCMWATTSSETCSSQRSWGAGGLSSLCPSSTTSFRYVWSARVDGGTARFLSFMAWQHVQVWTSKQELFTRLQRFVFAFSTNSSFVPVMMFPHIQYNVIPIR